MKVSKRLIIIILIAAAWAFAAYKILRTPATKQKAVNDNVSENLAHPIIAIFNLNDTGQHNSPSFQHLLLQWGTNSNPSINDELIKIIKAEKPVLVTVETWPTANDSKQKPEAGVLQQIIDGNFDERIHELSGILSKQKNEILLSLNPDMEVWVNVYPWQMQSPILYAKAYRHFADLIRKTSPNVKMVWAPAGYPGADEYWPGSAYVDFIGETLKGKSELMTNNYPEAVSQKELFERKIERVRFANKPILLLGSEKFTIKDFNQTEYDAAVNYIKENKEILYRDTGNADKESSSDLLRKGKPALGVFDPKLSLANIDGLNTEHIFVNLERLGNGSFTRNFDEAVKRNHDVIVTMEPWKDKNLEKDPALIKNILAGKYDLQFQTLFSIIKKNNSKTIYLRFLHEMEIPITRYPWQSQDPVMYIKAYRYFVNLLKERPANILMVWGPAGDRGSMEFWPGSDVVDYVSIAIYGLPDKNISDHTMQESFNAIYSRKYYRVRMAHKPLFITEFGVKGPEDYKKQWLLAAAETINSDSLITGINYFNFADNPKAWGDKIETPDWSTSVAVFNDFIKQLNLSSPGK